VTGLSIAGSSSIWLASNIRCASPSRTHLLLIDSKAFGDETSGQRPQLAGLELA
jgi:hypothetical protein